MNEVDASLIRDKPEYTIHTISGLTLLGNTYLVQIEAYNQVGSVFSETIGFVLASVPDTPSTAPYSDLSVTTTNRVKINIDPISGDGGSPILSYSIEIDNGMGG